MDSVRDTVHIVRQFSPHIREILIPLCMMALSLLSWKALCRFFVPKLETSRRNWDDVLLKSFRDPVIAIIVFVSLNLILQIDSSSPAVKKIGSTVFEIVLIGSLFWGLFRFISSLEKRFIEVRIRKKTAQYTFDSDVVYALCRLARMFLIIGLALMLLQALGISSSGVVAFGGLGGVAIGFAAKDLLANFFGGLLIYLDRPFVVGDWIRLVGHDIEGTVQHIGWRLTRVLNFAKRPVYMPNALFLSAIVETPSRMNNRRIRTVIGLRYEDADKVCGVLNAVRTMLQNHPDIDQQQTLLVHLIEFGPSSLNFLVYAFTQTTELAKFQAVQEHVFLSILNLIREHGAQCAFPTTTVHLTDKYVPVTV